MNFFFERYRNLGENPSQVAVPITIRANTLKNSKQKLITRLKKRNIKVKEIDYLDYGLQTSSKFSIGSTVEYLLGLYYIQSAAAQVPVQVLFQDSKPAKQILDMCAAPGGKTTQIAQYTKSPIVALDIKKSRLDALKNNLERLNISNVSVFNMLGQDVSELKLKFDRILLDAPCSGNFVADKRWFDKRSLSGIKKQARLQLELLESAYTVLDKGGVLVYSTCSLEPEENEHNIAKFLESHPDMGLENIPLSIGSPSPVKLLDVNTELKKCIRFWPWKTNTEGFFVARMIKR